MRQTCLPPILNSTTELSHDLPLHWHLYLAACLWVRFRWCLQPTPDIQTYLNFWSSLTYIMWAGLEFNIHPLPPYFLQYEAQKTRQLANSCTTPDCTSILPLDLSLHWHLYLDACLWVWFRRCIQTTLDIQTYLNFERSSIYVVWTGWEFKTRFRKCSVYVTIFRRFRVWRAVGGTAGRKSRDTLFFAIYLSSHNFFKKSGQVVSEIWPLHLDFAPDVPGYGLAVV